MEIARYIKNELIYSRGSLSYHPLNGEVDHAGNASRMGNIVMNQTCDNFLGCVQYLPQQ